MAPEIHHLMAHLDASWPLIFFRPHLKMMGRVPGCNIALSQNVEAQAKLLPTSSIDTPFDQNIACLCITKSVSHEENYPS